MTTPSRDEVLRVAGEQVAWLLPNGKLLEAKNVTHFGSENDQGEFKVYPTTWKPLYTESQLLAMYAAGAEAMRERAAEVCEECANNTEPDDFALDAVNDAAASIRALPITHNGEQP